MGTKIYLVLGHPCTVPEKNERSKNMIKTEKGPLIRGQQKKAQRNYEKTRSGIGPSMYRLPAQM